MRYCLYLSKQSKWTSRRIHALKANALLSGSANGRGFGSVFHLQSREPKLVSGVCSVRQFWLGKVCRNEL